MKRRRRATHVWIFCWTVHLARGSSSSSGPPPPPPPSNDYYYSNKEEQQQQQQQPYPSAGDSYYGDYRQGDGYGEAEWQAEQDQQYYSSYSDQQQAGGWGDRGDDGYYSAAPQYDQVPDTSRTEVDEDFQDAYQSFNQSKYASSSAQPIHYYFPEKESSSSSSSQGTPSVASARRDIIAQRFLSSTMGRIKLTSSAGLVGGMLGVALVQSLLSTGTYTAFGFFGMAFVLTSMCRNPYGELVRALAAAVLLWMDRQARIKKEYPTKSYILPALGLTRPKSRFPPTRQNLWQYKPVREQDPEFHMLYTIVVLAILGSWTGSHLISLIRLPGWMGGLAGAILVAGGGTVRDSPRGDLLRVVGMRGVALGMELWHILQTDLQVLSKTATVTSLLMDKALILDRQHRIKDRLIRILQGLYDQAVQASNAIQNNSSTAPPPVDPGRDQPPPADDRRRPPPDGMDRRRPPPDGMDRRRPPPTRDDAPPRPGEPILEEKSRSRRGFFGRK